ncbi:MAG: glycerate kinase [Chloroflexi bacterium]|nr:glycerate kinase [Chloroflexota bacterium]
MRIIVAPQEYKGTLTAEEAAAAIADGVHRTLPEADVEIVPMADGGPGTVRAIASMAGGEMRTCRVRGPLGRPVEAGWASVPDGTAIIEMAAAAGLTLLAEDERDARLTTTYGVGELVREALGAGARRLIIGLGGSATNDGGAGMAAALGARLLDASGDEIPPGGAALARLDRVDAGDLDPRLAGANVIGASDVTNPLCGPEGASFIYGPQKGASPESVRELDGALENYARVIERDLGVAVRDVAGAGAAGGLGAGIIAFLGAEIRPGVDVVAEVVGLRERLNGADLVVTGEGRLDGQTRYGKTVAGVARLAAAAGAPLIVVPGGLGPGWEWALSVAAAVEPVVAGAAAPVPASSLAAERLSDTVARVIRSWRPARG